MVMAWVMHYIPLSSMHGQYAAWNGNHMQLNFFIAPAPALLLSQLLLDVHEDWSIKAPNFHVKTAMA